MAHLKRLASPRTWFVKRKGIKFITRPKPSGIEMDLTLPINTIFKELLQIANNSKEVKYILQKNRNTYITKHIIQRKRAYCKYAKRSLCMLQ